MDLEARVRARMADELRQAERLLRDANIAFQRAIDGHTRAGRRYELCASKVSQRRAEGRPITAKMQEELDGLHAALIRSYERRIRARNKRDELGARVRVLGSKEE